MSWFDESPPTGEGERLYDAVIEGPRHGACCDCIPHRRVPAVFEVWTTVDGAETLAYFKVDPYTTRIDLCEKCVAERRLWDVVQPDKDIRIVLIRPLGLVSA